MLKKLIIPMIILFALAAGVSAADSINIFNGSVSMTGSPGSTLSSMILVQNTGTTNYTASFSDYTLTLGSETFSITSITGFDLNTGDDQLLSLSITIPPDQKAGTYDGDLKATGGSASDTVHVSVTVDPTATSPEVSMSCGSATYIRGVTGAVNIEVDAENIGNTDIGAVNFAASDLQSGSESYNVNPLPSSTPIGYGDTETISFQVVGLAGNTSTGTYSSVVNATYDNGTGTETRSCTMQMTVNEPNYDLNTPSSVDFPAQSQNSSVSKVITVQNNGNVPINNVQMTHTAGSQYSLTLNQSNLGTLAAGESADVMVSADIPADEASGKQIIGSLFVNGTRHDLTTISNILPLKLDVRGKLNLDRLDVTVGGSSDKDVEDSQTIDKEAGPGDKVKFELDIENTYTDDEDIEIEDVIVEITIFGIDGDDADDLEEESDEFDIKEDSKEEDVTIEFELDNEIKEGTYEVEIKVRGEDENGKDHEVEWTVYLEVEKESHDIIITKASLGDSTIDEGDSTTLHVTILNIGKEDEDEVVLEIKNSDLGLDIRNQGIELESEPFDDEAEYDRFVSIDGDKAGTYDIIIKVYHDEDELADSKIVRLTVEGDSSADDGSSGEDTSGDSGSSGTGSSGTSGSSSTDVEVEHSTSGTSPATSSGVAPEVTVTDTTRADLRSHPLYMILLMLGNLFVVILIVVAIALLLRKPKKKHKKTTTY
ncbi:hypothetical protein GF351_02660 [Candidatus Woesearchaeota archaeon]|nr:hypothetical protein [Candidatus Woesearchaeota archaeon]